MLPDENPTIGIVLCRDKNNAVVEMTLPEDNTQIFASKYETVLPSKEALQKLLEEQPDLMDIKHSYQRNGGEFWIALSDGKVIGTIGLMLKEKHCAILKKFFVKQPFRSQKIGFALYRELLKYAKQTGIQHIILDTPSVAHTSHRFYEKAGFHLTIKEKLPVTYVYPDRDSLLYILDLG